MLAQLNLAMTQPSYNVMLDLSANPNVFTLDQIYMNDLSYATPVLDLVLTEE